MLIQDLQLAPVALQGASILYDAFWEVLTFTSGARTLEEQARAMAHNVQRNRRYIAETYTRKDRPSHAVATALQVWVDGHPQALTTTELASGFLDVLNELPHGRLISYHCWRINGQPASLAFDLEPLEDLQGFTTLVGHEVRQAIQALPGLDAFVTREGGLHIWHVQFAPPITVEV